MLPKGLLVAVIAAVGLRAETGRDAWLRYMPLANVEQVRPLIPAVIVPVGGAPEIQSAASELARGLTAMLGRPERVEAQLPGAGTAIVVGTWDSLRGTPLHVDAGPGMILDDAWRLRRTARFLLVTSYNPRGVLYGAFALLRKVALGEPIGAMGDQQAPYAPVRWVNEWDNLDGSIERGYAGRSIFWEDGRAHFDLSRVSEYGRLLASLGINACAINNVNANPRMLSPELIADVVRIAAAFRPWGVRVAIAVDFGSPKTLGGLDTFDPLDARVAAWWRAKADEIYGVIPDFAGFVLKADSEGRVGPSTYGRTHADAANVVARGLAPHGGLLFYRGFVYDHHMDWRNPKKDRARAAYDNFKSLDGQFDSNVVVQIKNGPIDFQVREPASPLFGALEKTNQAIELQITQEYMGQARHTVFLGQQWKTTLDFDMHSQGPGTPVKALVAGRVFHQPVGGFVGVANIGLDDDWTANQLSQANLYAFGRLAWNPDLTAERIINEWTRLTFGNNPKVVETITALHLASWRNYENYTGPLGLQTLTDITGSHFGPAVEASERNGWGQWHFADEHGVGMDRTVATGTGFIGQYRPAVARVFESLATCPDDLLLFFHHVPYTYVLHSGKTVIQTLYDLHYKGAAAAAAHVGQWRTLNGLIDDARYRQVLAQLEYQAGSAEEWRDAVVTWFWKTSGIADTAGRAGHFPGRIEAESMHLDGYVAMDVKPWETASGGKCVECPAAHCAASFAYQGAGGRYNLRVRYFDQNNGISHFRLTVAGRLAGEWYADAHLPARKPDGASSSLYVARGIELHAGDEIRLEGEPGGPERAAVDYVEIEPAS